MITTEFAELSKTYYDTALQYVESRCEIESESEKTHIVNIVKSVMFTRDGIMIGGSFVDAIQNNNLREAINRADKICLTHLKLIVNARYNCYIDTN